jgi:hypothetical protein
MISCLAQRRELCRMCTGLEGLGKRTRKELYRLSPSGDGVIAAFIRSVAEHGDANPGQPFDHAPKFDMRIVSAPAAIRCHFAWSDRDYRELAWPKRLDQRDQLGAHIALDVEFHRARCQFRQPRQRDHVVERNMPCIRTRVDRQAPDAGSNRLSREVRKIGLVAAPRIPEEGDLVQVQTEDGHRFTKALPSISNT